MYVTWKSFKDTYKIACLVALILLSSLFFVGCIFSTKLKLDHFSLLADSMINGQFFFNPSNYTPNVLLVDKQWMDTAPFNGKYYWPLGLFPALLIMPFRKVLGSTIGESTISPILSVLIFYLLYQLGRYFKLGKIKATFLALSYLLGSAYLYVGVLSYSWYYSHVVATACLLASLYFILVKKRLYLSSIFFSLAILSRISIVFGLVFYITFFYLESKEDFFKKVLRFIIPLMLAFFIFFLYNYVRFGNIFETGYSRQILYSAVAGNKEVGLWNIRHIPTNIYLFFLKGPDVVFYAGTYILQKLKCNFLGMSFFITSPIFLWMLFANIKNNLLNKAALAGVLSIFIFLMGSFGTGAYQYGYRFALDFQPFLFLILLSVFSKRDFGILEQTVVVFSAILNVYLLFNGLTPE